MPVIDPVILPIAGPLAIRWYGLMYVVGLGGAWLLAQCRWQRLGTDGHAIIQDMLFFGLLGGVVGGRLGYMIFYQSGAWWYDWLKVWQGGMSFHGGLLGVVASFYVVARLRSFEFWTLADFAAPIAPVALACGRLGNFLNAELWGRVTDVPWAVVVPWLGNSPRHPSQLYECLLEGVLLFLVLWFYSRYPRAKCRVSAWFLMGYALARFVAEFFREPDRHLGFMVDDWVTMGQLLCVPMLLAGASLWFFSCQFMQKK